MELLFLGTGAADWPVAEFDYRKLKNGYKRYASLVIDGELLIDCGSCALESMETFGVDQNKIKNILITHSHEDHWDQKALIELLDKTEQKIIHLYIHEKVNKEIPTHPKLRIHHVKPKEAFTAGNYKIKALKANHIVEGSEEECMHYIIENQDQCIFYGCDGAWLLCETWEIMRQYRFDAMILDATIGVVCYQGIFDHNSFEMLKLMQLAFLHGGVMKPQCRLLLSHMAVTLCPAESDYDKMARAYGMEAICDGQSISI